MTEGLDVVFFVDDFDVVVFLRLPQQLLAEVCDVSHQDRLQSTEKVIVVAVCTIFWSLLWNRQVGHVVVVVVPQEGRVMYPSIFGDGLRVAGDLLVADDVVMLSKNKLRWGRGE